MPSYPKTPQSCKTVKTIERSQSQAEKDEQTATQNGTNRVVQVKTMKVLFKDKEPTVPHTTIKLHLQGCFQLLDITRGHVVDPSHMSAPRTENGRMEAPDPGRWRVCGELKTRRPLPSCTILEACCCLLCSKWGKVLSCCYAWSSERECRL